MQRASPKENKQEQIWTPEGTHLLWSVGVKRESTIKEKERQRDIWTQVVREAERRE